MEEPVEETDYKSIENQMKKKGWLLKKAMRERNSKIKNKKYSINEKKIGLIPLKLSWRLT